MRTTTLRPAANGDGPAEVWLLDVLDEAGPRALGAVEPPEGWSAVPHGSSMNGTALVAIAGAAELGLPVEAHSRLRLLRHPWSGGVRLEGAAGGRDLDLRGPDAGVVELRADGEAAEGVVTDPIDGSRRSLALEPWLAEVAARRPVAVGLVHPDWRGVRTATEHHFTYVLAVPADPAEDDAVELAERLAATGIGTVVSAGLPAGQRALIRALHRHGVRILVTWHASFLQHGENANHEALLSTLALAHDGVVARIGFTKPGMAGVFGRTGVPTATVLNHLRDQPRAAPPPADPLARVGIWSVGTVWRKIPYAMLAACAALDPVPHVRASGSDAVLAGLAELLGVPFEPGGPPVPRAGMAAALAGHDLNLYVTLSECGPMLPLESLAAGRPCLIGPGSGYFDEDPFLRERLVVAEPDRHERIADAMRRAHAEREAILEHLRTTWWPAYGERARRSVREFLEADADDLV